MINIEKIEIDVGNKGHLTNTYLIFDSKINEAILFDPADNAAKIIDRIKQLKLNVKYICITHAHGDHFGALEELAEYTKADILIHRNDYFPLIGKEENYSEDLGVKKQSIDRFNIVKIYDGYNFRVGDMNFEVIHTPGHTSGCICVYEKMSNSLFTGDTIFYDCYGRCDLHSANFDDMVTSIRKLFERFDDITIYPGHDKIVNISSAKKYIRMLMAMKNIKL